MQQKTQLGSTGNGATWPLSSQSWRDSELRHQERLLALKHSLGKSCLSSITRFAEMSNLFWRIVPTQRKIVVRARLTARSPFDRAYTRAASITYPLATIVTLRNAAARKHNSREESAPQSRRPLFPRLLSARRRQKHVPQILRLEVRLLGLDAAESRQRFHRIVV